VRIVDTLRDVVALIQKANDVELHRISLDLQTQVFGLLEENRGLKEKLATRESLTFDTKKNSYWKGADGPYCSACFDSGGMLIRLHQVHDLSPMCPKCQTVAVESGRPPAAHGRALMED
jgi:hypothetical protein